MIQQLNNRFTQSQAIVPSPPSTKGFDNSTKRAYPQGELGYREKQSTN